MPGLEEVLMAKELPPSEPPVEMSNNPFSMFMRWLTSNNANIELPNESGIVDPKLPNVGGQLLKSFRTLNDIAAGQGGAAENLRNAGLKGLGRK